MFVVIYLWRGERHVTPAVPTYPEALELLGALRAARWQAWVEAL